MDGACAATTCDDGFADCDGDAANGCEVELASNADHCDACGHSCLLGTCNDGACEPVTIATAQSNAKSLAANDTHVFWTSYRDPDPNGLQGGVQRADAATLETVAIIQGLCEPTSLAIDQTSVYVGDLCTFINQDAEEVYKANLDGSLLTPLSDDNGCKGPIALTGDTLYFWALEGMQTSVYSIDTTIGNPSPLFSDTTLVSFNAFVARGDEVFWTTNGLSVQRIKKADVTIDPPPEINLWNGSAEVTHMAISGDRLFATLNQLNGTIVVDTTQVTGIETFDAEGEGAIATDATHVYYGANTGTAVLLRRQPVAGGAVETVATLTKQPRAIVVTDLAIHWEDDGAIMRLAK